MVLPSCWRIHSWQKNYAYDIICLSIQSLNVLPVFRGTFQRIVTTVSPVDVIIRYGNSPWLGAARELNYCLEASSFQISRLDFVGAMVCPIEPSGSEVYCQPK